MLSLCRFISRFVSFININIHSMQICINFVLPISSIQKANSNTLKYATSSSSSLTFIQQLAASVLQTAYHCALHYCSLDDVNFIKLVIFKVNEPTNATLVGSYELINYTCSRQRGTWRTNISIYTSSLFQNEHKYIRYFVACTSVH